MNYDAVIKEIVNVIKLSNEMKNKLSNSEFAIKKHFTFVYPFYIYNKYLEKYRFLLEEELKYFLLNYDAKVFDKNNKLIVSLEKRVYDEKENEHDFKILIDILKQGMREDYYSLLAYYRGYYVLNTDLDVFILRRFEAEP